MSATQVGTGSEAGARLPGTFDMKFEAVVVPVTDGRRSKRNDGEFDARSPEWYAEYPVAESAGTPLPS
jgi:hypothetical protein